MKIIYDDRKEVYIIKIENTETVTMIHTNDIVEVREEFVRCITQLFNNTVCAALKNKFEENDK